MIFILVKIIKKIQVDNNGQQYILFRIDIFFSRINTSKENFDVDYEARRIQTFISQFKDNKSKELADEIDKLKLQLANLSVKNNEVIDKK